MTMVLPALRAGFERERATALCDAFTASFGGPPRFLVRAPGRVNLLGEHTDYNGLPVLPMAIDRSVLMVGRPRPDRRVEARNRAPRFAARAFELECPIPPGPTGDWGNYLKAAAQGLSTEGGVRLRLGADLLVDGNIPSGAGLSSSSALVVAAALALLTANEIDLPFTTLAEILPGAEQYVGTLSGGMDQAISLLAREGHALRIDFFPLRQRPVHLPEAARIVVCHSLVEAEKAGAAREAYNRRVFEGRLACAVLNHALAPDLPHQLRTLGDLVELAPGRSLAEFIPILASHLPDRPLALAEIAPTAGTSRQELQRRCGIPEGMADSWSILARARHVLSEAERVNRAEEALRAGDLGSFGELMNLSHESCRDDYNISCPELEELVDVARAAGALGARLTGAGFGGCTVNLVERDQLGAFLQRIDERFYRARSGTGPDVSGHRFVFQPRSGAEACHLQQGTDDA